MRTQIWSSGGGVQSTAIACLIVQGKLPKPDLAVIVDTEYELSTTWKYLENWTKPALAEVGVELVRVPKSQYATVDLYRNDDLLIPAFTTEGNGVGKLPTFCSNEWKQRVMRRWATDQGVTQADIWIGFTIDEMGRVTTGKGKWQNVYPLIDLRMTRGDCIASVERMGWPSPPRSSCYMCPNKTIDEWRWQKKHAPEDWEQAKQFQDEIQERDPNVWLTQQAKSLDEVDLNEQDDLFPECMGGCFT